MKQLVLTTTTLVILCYSTSAQSQQPYTGLEQRPIKALSEQQVDDLRAGRGMDWPSPPNSTAILARATFLSLRTGLTFLQTSAFGFGSYSTR